MLEKLTLFLLSLFTFLSPLSPPSSTPQATPSLPPTLPRIEPRSSTRIPPTQTIYLTNLTYTLYLQPLPDLKGKAFYKIKGFAFILIPNYTQHLSSETIVKENNCLLGINGGFYDKQNNPLGLLEINGKQISSLIDSILFNGFVWRNSSGHLDFGPTPGVLRSESPGVDEERLAFVFQTGPYINISNLPNSPNLPNQKHSRRMLIAKDTFNNLYFIAITGRDNTFSGPTLSELGTVFEQPELAKYKIMEIINLDGGSASSFYGGKEGGSPLVLEEFSPIGAFLCFQRP